jgi:adenosylcobyric acid synthase
MFRHFAGICQGYEIHMGETIPYAGAQPLNYLVEGGATDGYFLHARCWGTYLHGILDNPVVIEDLLSPYTTQVGATYDYHQYKEEQYDKLAALLREHINIADIYKSLQS